MGYRKFLSRLSKPLLERLEPEREGLDFGCGPGPTLSVMMEEAGHDMDLYDPYYHKDPNVFSKKYDFVCATEVVEHMCDPQREFTRLFDMLKPGAWLGLMTKLVIDRDAFRSWHYIQDPTHICFYSRETFQFISNTFMAEPYFVAKDVILLRKR